jgi:hypothetical protein
MQETVAGWDSIHEQGQTPPVLLTVFVGYLVLVLLVSIWRFISLMLRMRSPKESPEQRRVFCHANIASMKNLSMLTFLLSFFVLAWRVADVLQGVAVQKAAGVGFLAGALAETLATFSLGLFVCAVLYVLAMFYEGILARQKVHFEQAKIASHAPPAE